MTDGEREFEFEWPQQGDVDPSIFSHARIKELKFVANHYDLRGVQVKLSNGHVSPIFSCCWPSSSDHGDIKRENNSIICHIPSDRNIVKARACSLSR